MDVGPSYEGTLRDPSEDEVRAYLLPLAHRWSFPQALTRDTRVSSEDEW